MKALKVIGAVIGSLVLLVVVFLGLCFGVFWREPDARETCDNMAKLSANPKVASSDLGMRACMDSMKGEAYGFNNKRRLASYRRCLHDASSADELKSCGR